MGRLNKPYVVQFIVDRNEDGNIIRHQVLGDGINFMAYNMNECPEDAVIVRDVFDGYDYIEVLRLGMELA